MKKLLHLLCFFLTFANKNIDILIKSFFMGKFLQLKRCLATAVIALLGVTATWADATVVYEADMSQANEPDGWKCYKPKDDKGTWTTGIWRFSSYYHGYYLNQSKYTGGANDYCITKGIELEKGKTYTVTTTMNYTGGSAPTVTLELLNNISKCDASYVVASKDLNPNKDTKADETNEFTVSESGTYYFAIHLNNPVDPQDGTRITYLYGFKVETEEGANPDPEPGVDVNVYEADMSQANEPDGWKCYKPKDDKGTWTTGIWRFSSYYHGYYLNQSKYTGGANDYCITKGIELEKGKTYTVTTTMNYTGGSAPTVTLELLNNISKCDASYVVASKDLNPNKDTKADETNEFTVSESGTYYFAIHLNNPVDPQDGTRITYLYGFKVMTKAAPQPAVTPAAVTDLAAAVDYAASTVTLTWTNPTKDAEGNDLTEKVGAKIYKNGELMETIDELTGETTTKVLSPTPFEGEATFAVKAFIGEKESEEASAKVNMTKPAVTPAAVTDLAAAVDYAASTVTLTWTNPTKDAEGNDLTEKVGAKIYKNGELMETIDELTGETTTKVLSPTPFEGEATFAVKAFIGEKESEEVSAKVNMTKPVIIPAAVTNFDATVDYDAATVTLTWTNPTKDASGKELTEKVGAKIYKDEVLVETIDELTGKTTTKVLSPTPFEGEATFTVKTFIGEKESEAVSKKVDLTKPVPPVTAEEIPYTADLTKAETVATFKTIDANNDGITWTTVEGLNGLTYDSDDAKVAANDWAITPIIKFEADKNYAVAASFTRSGAFDEDIIDVYAGDEPTADKMTTKIGTFKIEDNAAEAKLRFIVAEEGNKYIGFHVVTPGSGDNGQLSLASVSITALEKATPLAVENLEGTVNSDDKTITLTWTNPTKDTEGYLIAETLGVKLYENDVLVKTVDDASEGTLVYSPENFSGETTYKVVPFIGAKDGEGATVTLNLNDLTGDLVLVKAFEFNKTAATSWTIINADKNSSKWEFDYDGFYFGGGSAADDWLISPALALNAKDRYVLKYEFKTAWQPSNNTFFADIDVTVGQGATAEAQTMTVNSHKGLSQNGYTEFQTKQFSVAADGQYNIGFHVTGIKGNANMRNLAVYAVGEATNSITEITEGGVVAYNKSNGALFVPAGSKVALYAANGTMAMQTIADGNAISLNSLANGIYVMKITSAEGKVMTQKIVK